MNISDMLNNLLPLTESENEERKSLLEIILDFGYPNSELKGILTRWRDLSDRYHSHLLKSEEIIG